MRMFCDLLKSSTLLKKVKAKFQDCNRKSADAEDFENEIEFYTTQKKTQMRKEQGFDDRMRSCNQESMF